LREALYRIFSAPVEGAHAEPADLARLNDELALALARARVAPGEVAAGAFAWTWDASPDARSALDAPLWPLARSAAELLTSPERALVKRCAGDPCLWLFLDRTKNHARRWCDMKVCGNRAKARRHRASVRSNRVRARGSGSTPRTEG
jgi:predicted RNA-binding Zn ribbon-like protein